MKKSTLYSIILSVLIVVLLSNCTSTTGIPDESASTQENIALNGSPDPGDDGQKYLSLYIDEDVPKSILPDLTGKDWIIQTEDRETADWIIHLSSNSREGDTIFQQTMQVYALVGPFYTLIDNVVFKNSIQAYWKGEGSLSISSLVMSDETMDLFSSVWGSPQTSRIQVPGPAETLDQWLWTEKTSWALIPFDELTTRFKVISVDGISPLDPADTLQEYPLALSFYLSGKPESETVFKEHQAELFMNQSNRDLTRMTRVVMTGVTALVRATADKMETKGITYPAQDIREWLRSADITHISNEISFIEGCPTPSPFSTSLQFCSDPKYIGLFEDVGADVIEMTGNHMNDWYVEGPALSMALYAERGWKKYGGGSDLLDSQQPALFDHNGNKIAFIGCNAPGPDYAFATETRGGSAPCKDYGWMKETIQTLKLEGYQVIVGIQYHENYSYVADDQMKGVFRPLVEAGALIVQGSQAHTPKEMEFYENGFIHYGLGNLFFDQMFYTLNGKNVDATRYEFLDRYTFYDNRLISIELLTAMLEDYAKPRPMTQEERSEFLRAIFSASNWE